VPERSKEDLDRELIELLNELRVALPGVQVLFAFLLILPFSQGFQRLTDFQKDTYLASLLLTAVATALLIAPSAFHRLEWRQHDKEWLLVNSNRLVIVGMVFLAAAMTASVWLITDFLFAGRTTTIVTALTAGLFMWFWYGWPLTRRLRTSRQTR
jgi:uncharacterized membrane-anchored protein